MTCGAAPAVDVVEKDNAYEVTAELPGMDEKNIEVKLVNDRCDAYAERHPPRGSGSAAGQRNGAE